MANQMRPSEGVEEVVTDMPVEVSLVTEVSSEAVELSTLNTHSSIPSVSGVENLVVTQADSLITSTRNDKEVAAVQYEVVTSDTNMLIDSTTEPPETTPTIEIAPPTSELISVLEEPVSTASGRRLSYSTEKDEAIARFVREAQARGEKLTMQQLCQHARSVIQEENPQFSASSGWAQRFLARHSLEFGRQKTHTHSKPPDSRGRPLSYSIETDKQLADYVRSRISEGRMFTNSELRKHAREVVCKENPNFTGSASWAQNFLHRHKISLQSMAYESPDSSTLLTQPTPSLSDNPIGPAAEITPTTSHPSMYSDPSQDETMKTALAILAGENIDSSTLQSSLSDMATDSVSLVDLLTNAQQLQDGSDDGTVSLITSGLESPSGSIYLNLGGAEGFAGGFSTQVDPNTQAPVPQEPPRPHPTQDVVAQASRPLTYTRETDQQLAKWVQEQQATGKKVTFASLRTQARKLIRQENPNFNASIGWVTPFLLRHNLDLNLNRKKPKTASPDTSTDKPDSLAESEKPPEGVVPTPEAPIITPDLLATAIATSLVEQAGGSLPSLAEQARLVLTQGSLALANSPQPHPTTTPSAPAATPDNKSDTPKTGSEKRDKSRNRHTLAEKLEVVRLMKEYNVAAHYVCRTLGIANSTYAGWTKLVSQKGPELEALSSNRKRANVKGQGRPLSYTKETDEAIAKWVRTQQQLGVQVTPSELGKHATTLISQESTQFTASSGWQQKFLQRHGLQLHSSWSSQRSVPVAANESKLAAEDQTSIPAPIQTEEVVANEFKPTTPEWPFGSEVDAELAKWVKDQVTEHGSYSVSAVCKKAEEVCQNSGFQANLGWAFKFLHRHSIMLDPKPTISQLCATALNRKRSSTDSTTPTPKKPRPTEPQDMSVSPSTGNLCEALLALSNQSSNEEPSPATMQAAIQTLQSAVAQVIQQQQLEEMEDRTQPLSPSKENKTDTPISQSSNTYFGKPAREFSSDEKEEVVRYANATTLQKAALKYGVAAPTVWRWRVELKLHQPKYTTMQKKYIIKFAENNSLREASTRYGISGKTIQNWRKSLTAEGDMSASNMEEVPTAAIITETMETRSSNEPTTSEVVTYDTQNFQFIVDGGEVVESRRAELPTSQGLVDEEPLSLEVTNEVDIENVGMEYDIVSSEGHAAKPRCTPEEKEHILQFALDHSVREASNKYGISQGTLYYWKKNMSSSSSSAQDTPTLTTATSVQSVNSHFSLPSDPELLATPTQARTSLSADQYISTSASSALSTESLTMPTYVTFLNTVSSLLTSEADQDKNKTSQILHSPTDVLVTPFTPHSDIETTATVTVVTSDGGVDSSSLSSLQVEEVVEVREKPHNELSMPSENSELSMPSENSELSMPSENNELSMPSEAESGLETISAEEVDISQTVELVDSEAS